MCGWYLNGNDDFPVDKMEALKWFELAVEQSYHRALFHLSGIYREEFGDIVRPSKSRAMTLMKEAADL